MEFFVEVNQDERINLSVKLMLPMFGNLQFISHFVTQSSFVKINNT